MAGEGGNAEEENNVEMAGSRLESPRSRSQSRSRSRSPTPRQRSPTHRDWRDGRGAAPNYRGRGGPGRRPRRRPYYGRGRGRGGSRGGRGRGRGGQSWQRGRGWRRYQWPRGGARVQWRGGRWTRGGGRGRHYRAWQGEWERWQMVGDVRVVKI
ncbi:uncharacterized protein [Dysidea avara]|uniref:uncharacterized protein n=1 Tax=Dysidea avara TaxID=196820 RepID=UPI00331C7534